MGLISFMKSAGEKLFGSPEEVSAPTAEEKMAKKREAEAKAGEALENLVRKMEIPVQDLNVKFSNSVADISGTTERSDTAEKAAVAVGNVRGVSEVENNINVLNPEPDGEFHTVVSGDYLSKIAKKYYGDANKYNVIFEANKPMLSHPDKIYPGQVLRIPKI